MNGLQLQENLKKYTRIEDCPIRNVLSRFSSKWAMLILCVLSENEATRFNTISKAIPDISPKVLTETLKALEADGLVKRKLYAEIPPRVEYSLTEVGQSLIPILNSLITWALDNSAYIKTQEEIGLTDLLWALATASVDISLCYFWGALKRVWFLPSALCDSVGCRYS